MPTKLHEESTEAPPGGVAGANGAHPSLLTREAILAARDIATEVVDVPEWGGSVMVRGLTGRARDSIEARFTDAKGKLDLGKSGDFRAAYVSLAIVDEHGALLFGEGDVAALGEKSSVAIQRIFDAAIRLSAVRAEDIDGITADLKDDPSGATG
jgi:hypothetical protein